LKGPALGEISSNIVSKPFRINSLTKFWFIQKLKKEKYRKPSATQLGFKKL